MYVFMQFLNCCILMGLLLFAYIYWDDNNHHINDWATILSGFSLILIIYQILVMRIRSISLLDVKLIFIAFAHLFLFGQIYLLAFGYGNELFYNVILRYPSTLIFKAGLFSICYVQAIFIGFMYSPKTKSNSKLFLKDASEALVKRLMYKTGIILFVLATPFKLYVDIMNVFLAQTSASYIAVVSVSGVSTDIAILFVPSILLIICSEQFSKIINKYWLWSAVSYLLIIMVLTGDRRYYVTAIIAMLLCFMRLYKTKIKLREIIKIGIIATLLLNFLAVIRTMRLHSLTSVGNFIYTYWKEMVAYNPIFETLNEFGVTILSVAFPIKYIPSIFSYQYGLSFYGAIPSLLPIGWLLTDFFNEVSMTTLLNPIEGYPVGGSLPGDLYANFGWWGILGAIIFGVILSKVFVIHENKNNNFNIAICYSAFYILINLTRATFIEIFRNVFIVILVPMLLMYVLKGSIKRGVQHIDTNRQI